MNRFAALIPVALFAVVSPARAQEDIAAFYRDKPIHLLIGSAAGSGYDIGARAVARYLPRYIPGNPTIVVQNQPGAASVTLANSLANVQPRDGTVMGALINGAATAPLLEPDGVRFDPTKLIWLGSVNREVQVSYVWNTAPVQTMDDLKTKQLIVGATAPGTTQVDYPVVADALLGLKYKVISGYEGTAQIHKAMEMGEVQGVGANALASLRATAQPLLDQGKIKIIGQWGLRRHPDLPDTPAFIDLATNDADRAALTLMLVRLEYGRPFVLPPGVPAARAAALTHAFEQVMKDPEFIAEAKRLNLEVDPVSSAEVTDLVRKSNATSPDVVKRVRDILHPKG